MKYPQKEYIVEKPSKYLCSFIEFSNFEKIK